MFDLDICKCNGDDCPMKETCLRHIAKDDFYQPYFREVPYKDNKCDQYLSSLSVATEAIQEEYLKKYLEIKKQKIE